MTEKKRKISNIILDILSSGKIWILMFFIIISLFAINYTFFNQGVVINGITPNSQSEKAQMNYDTKDSLRSLEKIYSINGHNINTDSDFYNYIALAPKNSTLIIITDKKPNGYNIEIPSNENLSNSEIIEMHPHQT